MKENVKFSVELQNPEKINPLITRYKVYICTPGEPANNFIFSKPVLEEMADTVLGCAIVAGFMNGEDASILGGHEDNLATDQYGRIKRTPKPVGIGFADPYIKPWFEVYKSKEFLTTYAYLWTGKFPELDNLSERNIFQSMEAVIDSNSKNNYKMVEHAMVLALCMLEDVDPAFKDSTFIKFSSEDYKLDIDKLKEEYYSIFSNAPKKYKDLDFTIPKGVKEQAEQGLNLRKEYNRGGTSVGLNTANYLINNTNVSPEKVKHIAKYFPRHSKDNLDEKNPPSNGLIAWKLWGGDEGWRWSQKLVDAMNKRDEENKKSKQSFEKNSKNEKLDSGDYLIKINKSKDAMSEKSWGDVDKTELMHKVIKAKNVKSIVDDIYALVEEGWEDAPSQHLKYPIMEITNDNEAVYNRYALKSALGYAKTQNENAIVNKINKIYKKLGLDKNNFSEFDLSEDDYNFIFADEIKEKEELKHMAKLNKEDKKNMMTKMSQMCDSQKYSKDEQEMNKYSKPIDVDEQCCYAYDKEMCKMTAIPYSMENDEVKMSFENAKKVKMGYTWSEMSDEEPEDDEDCDVYMSMIEAKTGKKFNSDENTEALVTSVRNEMQSEYDKKIADKELEMNQMKEEMSAMKTENDKLKTDEAKRQEQEKMAKVEYALQEVIDSVPKDKIEQLRTDANNFSLDNLNIWENKVYAEAYSFSKGINDKKTFNKMGLPFVEGSKIPEKSESIWSKIGNKN